MPLPSIKNSVGMAVTAVADSGQGTLTVGAALSGGYQTAATAYGANANIDIRIEEGDTWEVCRDCAYTHSGTTVTRGTLEDGSSGTSTRVAFTSAAKVYVVDPAARIHNDRNGGYVFVQNDGSTQQSLTSSAWNRLRGNSDSPSNGPFITEVADERAWWDAAIARFQPNIPGKYLVQITANAIYSATTTAGVYVVMVAIYKNGSVVIRGSRGEFKTAATASLTLALGSQLGGIVEMDGSSDYLEPYLYVQAPSGTIDTFALASMNTVSIRRIGD